MPPRRRLLATLEREVLLVVLFTIYCLVLLLALPQELVQDSWLTLVSGREVVEHGLPTHDRLTVWTLGVPWIDQQWLAQVAFYGLFGLGGIKLALWGHVALLAAAFGSGLAAARSRGASAKAVFLVAAVTMFLAPWALQMRAQSFAGLLFVWLLWLLVADARRPSRRVFLVLPLLVVWANLHGTVVLGAALVALHGGISLLEHRPRPRSVALVVAPFACLFCSPYGLSLGGYYHTLLANPMLHWFIDEWNASEPSAKTALFYLLAFATVWLVARHGRVLTRFERAALAVTLVSGLLAIRSIVWFALTALVILPAALDAALSQTSASPRVPRRAIAALAAAAVVATMAFVAVRPATWYTREWPRNAAGAIGAAAAHDPSMRVLSDDRYADWILWERPELAGRVAFDVRFELFSERNFRELFAYRNQVGDGWRRAGRGYRLVALDRTAERRILASLLDQPGSRLVYRDEDIAVVLRPETTREDAATVAFRPSD